MRKSRSILFLLAGIMLLTGIVIFFFPSYRTVVQNAEESQAIQSFQEYVKEPPEKQPEIIPPSEMEPTIPFPELREACEEYNYTLYGNEQERLSEESITLPALRLSDYGYEQEVFGCISIPAAEIESPLYLGASSGNLDKGAALLGQTSLPIGEENTHCVIAGHRSWNGAIKFRGIESLSPGDTVYLTNPWETLTYTVVKVQIIRPDEIEKIKIQPGRDLLSIFTCTYPNTRRVLVTCERAA